MKIIDLLNKIAEGKELPKKFMCKGHLYYRQKTKGVCYRCDELNEIFEECFILEDLNDTVEIIEEPKKIKKIEMVGCNVRVSFLNNELVGTDTPLALETTIVKVNELIDEVNKLI